MFFKLLEWLCTELEGCIPTVEKVVSRFDYVVMPVYAKFPQPRIGLSGLRFGNQLCFHRVLHSVCLSLRLDCVSCRISNVVIFIFNIYVYDVLLMVLLSSRAVRRFANLF